MIYQGKTIFIQEFTKDLSAWDMEKVETKEKEFRVFSMKASLPSLKRGVEKVRVLICLRI